MKLCALNREELDALFGAVGNEKIKESDLSDSFSSLAVSKAKSKAGSRSGGGLGASKYASPPITITSTNGFGDYAPVRSAAIRPSIDELATVLQALRKLREAITASNRTDTFARRAYYFNIHAAILCSDWESYLPALHSLLNNLHPANPLPPSDLRHFVGLMILDQACRQADYAGARATKMLYRYQDRRVEAVLSALVADDWVTFWRVRRSVDGYQRAVMGWADGRVRVHALKCLGKAYMRADKRYIERVTERRWEELVKDGVGWELVEGEKVVIQKVKGR